jgi:hypothetical protein
LPRHDVRPFGADDTALPSCNAGLALSYKIFMSENLFKSHGIMNADNFTLKEMLIYGV